MAAEDSPAPGGRERIVVLVVTATFGVLLVLWATLVPAFEAPDERAHFDAAVHVAIGDGWVAPGDLHLLRAVDEAGPGTTTSMGALLDATGSGEVETVDQMTQHPATYYVLAAGVLHLVDFAAHRPAADVLALRLLGALFVLPLPALAWATVRRATGSPRAAVVGAFAVLAVPELASIGASVSNDPPVVLFGAVTVWAAVRVLTGDTRTRDLAALGLALGVAILWKGTALPLIPFVAVAAALSGRSADRRTMRSGLLRATWVLALAAVVGAWWWLRNLLVFHTLQPDGYSSLRPPQPFPAGTGPDPVTFVGISWTTIARTFWGSFGGGAQWVVSPVVYETATVLGLGAVLVWGFRRRRGLGLAVTLAVLPLTVVVSQTATSWNSYLVTTFVGGTQGRYSFPAMVAFIALSAIAWRRALGSPAGRRRFTTVVSAVAVALALYGPFVAYTSFAETARARVTPSGLAVLAASTPVPVPVVVAAWIIALALGIAAVLLSRRVPGSTEATSAPSTPAIPSVSGTGASA